MTSQLENEGLTRPMARAPAMRHATRETRTFCERSARSERANDASFRAPVRQQARSRLIRRHRKDRALEPAEAAPRVADHAFTLILKSASPISRRLFRSPKPAPAGG